ncbi:DUF3667 domain-containing protein [Draconibacterium mangrovi]|uniref:DUF3667 domain-containing protein n=1 Tax=Draconibacterium mangrovi TaxID=2697469 RepID=UPI0013D2407E|nr:DUF3667 domain-containing protein [Draconibacterium mangrovi]
MPDLPKPNQCPACQSSAIDNYCSNCGQKIYNKRFTLKGFLSVVGVALNLERGFFFTLIWMFRNPGKVIDDYLNGRTKPYLNPLNYLLIIFGIYAFMILSFNIYDSSIETTSHFLGTDQRSTSPETLEFQKRYMELARKYINLIPLIMIPLASLFSKWYYRRKQLYYGEHLIINTFIFAQIFAVSIILSVIMIAAPRLLAIYPLLSAGLSASYFTYSYYRYFGKSVFNAFLGAMVMYLGGFILLLLIFTIVLAIWLQVRS